MVAGAVGLRDASGAVGCAGGVGGGGTGFFGVATGEDDRRGDAEGEGDCAGGDGGGGGGAGGEADWLGVAEGEGAAGDAVAVAFGMLVPGGGCFTRRFRLFGPGSIGRTGSLIGLCGRERYVRGDSD